MIMPLGVRGSVQFTWISKGLREVRVGGSTPSGTVLGEGGGREMGGRGREVGGGGRWEGREVGGEGGGRGEVGGGGRYRVMGGGREMGWGGKREGRGGGMREEDINV